MAGVITALKFQTKDRRRVNIYLDGEFGFGLAVTLAAGLKVGQELSDTQITRLQAEDEGERAYQRALRLVSRRPRSEHELRDYFDRKGVPFDVQDSVLVRLREAGLADDQAFAQAWIENRQAFRPRGTLALRQELRQKGVSDEVIEEALQGFDELQAARAAARRGARRWRGQERQEFTRRLRAYLARRGFDYEIISTVVEQAWCAITRADDESEATKWTMQS